MIVISPLQVDQADDVARIEKQNFSLPWSRAMILSELNNPCAVYLAAEENGSLVGYSGMRIVLDEGHITNVAVVTGHRRRGIATSLLKELRARAETYALSFITLEVRASNAPAIALYKSHGFRSIGLRPGYYEKPREDALIMTLYL